MDSDSSVTNLDFLMAEERERLRLAEDRIKTYDSEAAAAITAAIALGAAILAGFSGVKVSALAAVGIVIGAVCFVVAVGAGILSRRVPEPLIRVGKYTKGVVAEYDAATRSEQEADEAIRSLTADTAAGELRQRSLELRRARVRRAQISAKAKECTVRVSLIALYIALVPLWFVAFFQFFPPT